MPNLQFRYCEDFSAAFTVYQVNISLDILKIGL